MLLHTVIVDGYNVKFSKEIGFIKVSIPGHSCNIFKHDKRLSNEFKNILLDINWTSLGITKLQDFILSECMKNGLNICVYMNTQTGNITDTC